MKNTILLVDDDVTIVNLLDDILTDAGYTVLKSFNGLQALEILQGPKPDLIVLDWNMPVMDGPGVLRALSSDAKTSEIPVIMLTGVMTDPENLKIAFEAGAFDFIRKDFDTIELLSRIRAALKFVAAHHQIVQLKNNELIRNALKIAKHNHFILSCLHQVTEMIPLTSEGTEMRSKLSALKSNILSMSAINHWNHFNDHFMAIHPDFYKKLSGLHPRLGPAELKICALLKLNLSTKEIANVTCLTPDTIKTARTRIRKKLQIPSDDNLTSFLMQF